MIGQRIQTSDNKRSAITKSLAQPTKSQSILTTSKNENISGLINNNLEQEKELKKTVAENKAKKFFTDRSDVRRSIIEGKITTGNKVQDMIGNNRSELADAVRMQFINAGYEGTDGFDDEMLFNALYSINPKSREVVDYYGNNGGDVNAFAYYILHPEEFQDEKKDSSLFSNVIGASYDVVTAIPRTLATRGAKGVGAIAKGLGADEENVNNLVQNYIDYTNKNRSSEAIGADKEATSYKISKGVGELAMFLAGEGALKGTLKGVDVASKIGMANAPTWVKGVGKWAAESIAEGASSQALDDMVEQELSSAGQYGLNIGINALFNGLGEIGGQLLRPNEKMTTVLKNIDPNKADDIVKQTKYWAKTPGAKNPLDSKLDEVVELSREVASDKSNAGQILGRIRNFMKSDATKTVSSSLDDINAALNKIDDLGGVQILKNSDGTFSLSQKVLGGGKELDDLVSDMNILVKNSDNLRGYDQLSRLLNKYSGEAAGAGRKQLSTALKSASESVSKGVDDALSKYFINEAGKLYPQTTTQLAVRGADTATDALPDQFFADLKSIYGEGKNNYKLLSEFEETLAGLTDDTTKGMRKLRDIFGDAGGENYYRFLKSLESLGYERAGKLADEIVGTVYTMGLYGKDLMEESVKKFYPSVPGLYELGIKSALDIAKKKLMGPSQIAAGKTSVFNPVRDAIRTNVGTQYLGEIIE